MSRTDVDRVHDYLLGDLHAGPGLLNRVRRRVNELSDDPGPVSSTSSIMLPTRGRGKRHFDLTDEGESPKLLALATGLLTWLRGSQASERQLTDYLHSSRLTDTEYLLGRPNREQGLLSLVKQRVRHELGKEIPDTALLKALGTYLREWLDDACEHEWVPVDSNAKGVTVYRCRLGCSADPYYSVDDSDKDEQWRAV